LHILGIHGIKIAKKDVWVLGRGLVMQGCQDNVVFLNILHNNHKVKVFTYQGKEFHKDLQELCEKALIDHCTISQDHHEVDMLVEWIMQTVK
jgi:hypothetical protein